MRKKILTTRFILLTTVFVVLIGLLGLKFWAGKNANAAWFNNNWAFRQRISFTNGGGSTTKQKISLTIDTATLITNSQLQSSCQDLRFTDISGKQLQYFINTAGGACNTSTTNVFVLLANIPAGANEMYMYYGNPAARAGTQNAQFSQSTFSPSVGPTFQAAEIGSGPTLWWKFDDATGTTTQDSTINANTGTLGGSTIPTWQTEDLCLTGKCLYFDGSTSKVTGSKVANTVQSIAFWIRPNTIATQGLLNLDGGTHKISTNGSGVISATGFTSPTYYMNGNATTTPTLVQNQWNYVEITTGTSFNTTSSFTIGTDGTNFIKGFIDEVKFYNYVRTQAQVNADYLITQTKIGGTSATSTNGQKFLSEGLVGYWKMDENTGSNALDSSGFSHTMAWTGSSWTTGKYGSAGNFTNSNFLNMQANLGVTSGVTMSAWVNLSTLNFPTNVLNGEWIFSSTSASTYLALSATGTGTPFVSVNIGGVQNLLLSNFNPAANTWYLVTATYDGNRIRIYVNGQLKNTSAILTGAVLFDGGTNNKWIGEFSTGGQGLFSGQIDDVRIYNRGLSQEEVQQLYNFAPSPLGYWKLDEHTGTTANDSSSFQNTGTWAGTGTTHWKPGKFGSSGNFNGTDDVITVANTISGVESVGFWVKPSSTTANMFALSGSAYISASSGTITATGFTSPTIYVNGSVSSTLTANVWQYLAVTSGTTISASAITLGKANSVFFNGQIDDIRVYNYTRTQSQIQEDMQGLINSFTNSGGNTNTTQPAAPIGYWKFDEGYSTTANNDGSDGSTDNGTLTNMASPATSTSGWQVAQASCKLNKCLAFDGTNDYVAMPSDVSAFKITSAITLDAWVNLTSIAAQRDIIAKWTGTASTSSYELFTDSAGKLNMKISDGATITTVTGVKVLSTGTWYHVLGVYNPSTSVTLYINGNQDKQTTASIPAALGNSTTILDIGAENAGTNPMNGLIDEPKIYNFALTVDQIRTDYNLGSAVNYSGGTNEAANQPSGAGNAPVADWEFEERTGTTVNDSSGQRNTGTLVNSPTWTSGKFGAGLNFNGTNTDITFATTISSVKTVGFWVYPTTTTQYFLDLDGGTHYISASSGTVSATGFTSPTIYVNGVSGGTITAGTWNFTEVTTGTSFNTTTSMTFGKANGSNFLNGKLDHVLIYSYARSADQVAYDYNRGAPVARWKMDECQGSVVNDSSGNGNTGTITIGASGTQTTAGTCNTASTAWGNGATGKYNASVNFDGTDDFITTSAFSPLAAAAQTTTSVSWGSWVYPTTSAASKTILEKATEFHLTTDASSNAVCGIYYSAAFHDASSVTAPLTLNAWNHVVCTYDGANIKTYINGVLKNTTANTNAITTASSILYFAENSSAAQLYSGQIDDTRIYNYALTAAQVKLLYNNGSSVFYGPATGTP